MTEDELYQAFEEMPLLEIIRTQDWLSGLVRRRFGRDLALIFTDIAGSTKYFSQFGDEAGRRLQQRHIDTMNEMLTKYDGRIVDTAGDGAFAVAPTAEAAASVLIDVLNAVDLQNAKLDAAHRMHLRCGFHWGNVLTDGNVVTGDAVNFAARVSASAKLDQIRLTRATFNGTRFTGTMRTAAILNELPHNHRLRCRRLGEVSLKDVAAPVDMLSLNWLDRQLFPGHVKVQETGEKIDLPNKPTISFGRLKQHEGMRANDVILSSGNPELDVQISRWHFELRRSPEGFVLRPVSRGYTEVDGEVVQRGSDVLIKAGTEVRIAKVLTLAFEAGTAMGSEMMAKATMYVHE